MMHRHRVATIPCMGYGNVRIRGRVRDTRSRLCHGQSIAAATPVHVTGMMMVWHIVWGSKHPPGKLQGCLWP